MVPKEARTACDGMTYPPVGALEGYDVTVVTDPKQLKWIVKSKKKSDKTDSEKNHEELHATSIIPARTSPYGGRMGGTGRR